jgi:hypothetical protein
MPRRQGASARTIVVRLITNWSQPLCHVSDKGYLCADADTIFIDTIDNDGKIRTGIESTCGPNPVSEHFEKLSCIAVEALPGSRAQYIKTGRFIEFPESSLTLAKQHKL